MVLMITYSRDCYATSQKHSTTSWYSMIPHVPDASLVQGRSSWTWTGLHYKVHAPVHTTVCLQIFIWQVCNYFSQPIPKSNILATWTNDDNGMETWSTFALSSCVNFGCKNMVLEREPGWGEWWPFAWLNMKDLKWWHNVVPTATTRSWEPSSFLG